MRATTTSIAVCVAAALLLTMTMVAAGIATVAPPAWAAAGTGSISGVVTDNDGRPLDGCYVSAWAESIEAGDEAYSNASGVFKIDLLGPASYEVEVGPLCNAPFWSGTKAEDIFFMAKRYPVVDADVSAGGDTDLGVVKLIQAPTQRLERMRRLSAKRVFGQLNDMGSYAYDFRHDDTLDDGLAPSVPGFSTAFLSGGKIVATPNKLRWKAGLSCRKQKKFAGAVVSLKWAQLHYEARTGVMSASRGKCKGAHNRLGQHRAFRESFEASLEAIGTDGARLAGVSRKAVGGTKKVVAGLVTSYRKQGRYFAPHYDYRRARIFFDRTEGRSVKKIVVTPSSRRKKGRVKVTYYKSGGP